MTKKPTYEELKQRVKELEKEAVERKKAEEALRDSEAELFTIYNNSPIIMFLVDEDRRVLKANQLALESTNRQYDEIVGLRGGEALRCIHAADPAGCGFGVQCEECIVRNTVLDSLRTGNAHHNIEAPVQLDLGDGVIDLWLLVSTSPLNVAGKKSVLVCLVNITERKRAGKMLRASAQEWKTTFNSISDSICLLNKEGKILQCNEAMANLLGKPANEIKGSTCWELIHGTSEPIEGCPFVRMRETCRREALVLPLGDRWLNVVTDPLLDEDGNLKGAVHIIADISEQKQTEEALRESEVHYRQLVELCPDIVAVHSEGKIVFINSAGARLLGAAKPEQLIEKPIMDFVHPDYQEIIKERVREMRKKRRAVPLIEEKFIRLDGTYIDVEVAAMPFIYQDKEAVQIVARDITKRKRAEEKIKASLKEKEVLLKEIHHRVKNNLQIISSLLDLSRRRTENQEAVDLLSDARAKVHTMALIHAQLYQSDRFDRIDMGRHIQELFNFLAAIYETKSRFVTYLAKPSDVSLELTQAIPCALVLNEVISNAFKHAFKEGEKGTIEASIQRTADDTIVIRIKDDGKGIPEEIDIDKTNGLGFKLARNLVQSQLGGRIRVEGNGGTEIVIEFNASKEEREYA